MTKTISKEIKKLPDIKEASDIPAVKDAVAGKPMPNHIAEYFVKIEGSKEAFHSRELFKADRGDVDIKTELIWEEIPLIAVLKFNDAILEECGLPKMYDEYLYNYMRLKISKDRKSRGEFVTINTVTKEDQISNLAKSMGGFNEVKK